MVSSFFFFFSRLISAVADWMSVILARMVRPWCEFKMQVWNVLHEARWKYRTQKVAKNRHLGTIAQICWAIPSQLRHIPTIGKSVKQQYVLQMFSQHGEFRSISGWDQFGSLGAPLRISTGFASWQRYCTVLQQYASAKLCDVEQRAPPIFGRATITLGIGPHSSYFVV